MDMEGERDRGKEGERERGRTRQNEAGRERETEIYFKELTYAVVEAGKSKSTG